MTKKIEKTDDQWKSELSPDQYAVLRQAGTERPFSGKYNDTKSSGIYRCAGCQTPLFRSSHKFDSGSGWPSFWEPLSKDAVEERSDSTLGTVRTEVLCATCGGHLGHVFPDGPQPTGQRYCMNSVSLELDESMDPEAEAFGGRAQALRPAGPRRRYSMIDRA